MSFAVAPWAGTVVFDRFGARFLWLSVFAVGLISAVMMTRVGNELVSSEAPAV